MFNFDALTLDGVSRESIASELEGRGGRVVVSVPNPNDIVSAITEAVASG